MDCSMPGLPVHHQHLEFTQTHVHWVGVPIQPSHPLLSPSSPAFNPSQHQGLFQWVSSSHQVAKEWSFSFSISPSNEYSELISFRIDWFDLLAVQGTPKSLLQHHSSKASFLRHSEWANNFQTLTCFWNLARSLWCHLRQSETHRWLWYSTPHPSSEAMWASPAFSWKALVLESDWVQISPFCFIGTLEGGLILLTFFFPSLHNLLRLLHISRERSGFLEYFILLITSWDVLGEFWSNSDSESHSVVSDSLRPHGLYSPRNSPGQNTGVGGLPLLQGIFPTQGSNPGLPHCRRILYQLGHKGSPRILK